MRSTLRASTALIASLAIASGHLPVAAIAQEFDASQCAAGEDEDACLARLLQEAATEGGEGVAGEAGTPEDAVAEEAPTAAVAAPETEAAAPVAAEPEAEPPAAEQAAEPESPVEGSAAEAEAAEAATAEAPAGQAAPEEADAPDAASEDNAAEAAMAEDVATEEAATEDAATEDGVATEAASDTPAPVVTEAPVDQTAPAEQQAPAPDADEDALASALADAAEGGDDTAATTVAETTDAAEALLIEPEEMTSADAEALEAARAAAEAAEEAAAAPADPVAEAEAEIAEAEAEAAEAQQSLAIAPEAAPVVTATEETITEETARRSDEDFGRLLTATTENETRADDRDRSGLTGTQGLLLGGIAGLAIGSIIAGNREVVNRADDRLVVLRPQGDYQVIRDDDTLLRRPGNTVVTEAFADGSSRNVITQPDGTQVITVRDRDLRILRRTVVAPDGTRTVLIDDIAVQTPVVVSELPPAQFGAPVPNDGVSADADALARALAAEAATERGFSLAQIRSIRAVRDLAPAVNLESVTFDTGSAAIAPEQARQLLALGRYMSEAIAVNPREVFLIEGHTDATGSASFNLGLSDRRAETVALALTEYFGVPPQHMVIQGYGEEFLLIPTLENERLNRRVAVRRITDLLRVAAAD